MSCFRISRRSSLLTAAALMTVAGPAPALARDSGDGMDQAHKVADVVVTASGFEQRITQAPASISVLPRQEIEEIRATSIAEILNNIEGVDTGSGVGK